MPIPAITTGIIHIEIDCTPAKSNAVVLIGISEPSTVGKVKSNAMGTGNVRPVTKSASSRVPALSYCLTVSKTVFQIMKFEIKKKRGL